MFSLLLSLVSVADILYCQGHGRTPSLVLLSIFGA